MRDIADNPEDQVIVRSILDLAHNLGLETVAEGVETTRATQLLHQFGCDYTPVSNAARSFTYTVSDGRGGTVTSTVNITIGLASLK